MELHCQTAGKSVSNNAYAITKKTYDWINSILGKKKAEITGDITTVTTGEDQGRNFSFQRNSVNKLQAF